MMQRKLNEFRSNGGQENVLNVIYGWSLLAHGAVKGDVRIKVVLDEVPLHAALQLEEAIAGEAQEAAGGLHHLGRHHALHGICGGRGRAHQKAERGVAAPTADRRNGR